MNEQSFYGREACLWDLKLAVPSGVHGSGDPCDHLDDPYIGHVCKRVNFRPHMLTFLRSSPEMTCYEEIAECAENEGDARRLCSLSHVAALSIADPKEAQNICDSADGTRFRSECSFYAALGRLFDPSHAENKQEVASVCERIDDPAWRSECYFLIADEMAFEDLEPDLISISELCHEANAARDFGCHDHVVMLLSEELRAPYCEVLIGDEEPQRCAIGMGRVIALAETEGVLTLLRSCDTLSHDLVNSCQVGLALEYGGRSEDIIHGVEICEQFPERVRKDCIKGISRDHAVPPYTLNISMAEERCSHFPSEHILTCIDLIIEDIAVRVQRDMTDDSGLCDRLASEYAERCHTTLHQWDIKES